MNAELLIMFTLDCDRAYLYAHPERTLTAEESARYDEAVGRRATGVPAQYITGHQEFWGLDLIVSPAVLELVSRAGSKRSQNQDQKPRTGVSAAFDLDFDFALSQPARQVPAPPPPHAPSPDEESAPPATRSSPAPRTPDAP